MQSKFYALKKSGILYYIHVYVRVELLYHAFVNLKHYKKLNFDSYTTLSTV